MLEPVMCYFRDGDTDENGVNLTKKALEELLIAAIIFNGGEAGMILVMISYCGQMVLLVYLNNMCGIETLTVIVIGLEGIMLIMIRILSILRVIMSKQVMVGLFPNTL